jgi:arginine repressor
MFYRLRGAGWWLLPAVLVGSASAQITRVGRFWVETVTGSESVTPSGQLKVISRGPVMVTGSDGDQVHYTLIKKVKARDEADARRLLNQFVLRASRSGDVTTLNAAHGNGTAELTIRAPRTLRLSEIDTHGGRVEVMDLDGSVETETGGGAIRLDRIGGDVSARTAGGEIKLGTVKGRARCSTAGGAIRAQNVGGELVCETAGGEIAIEEAGGPVRASTAGGSIRVARAGAAVTADTAGGSIDVGHASGMVKASTSGGSIDVGAATGVRCDSAGGGIRLSKVSGSVRASTAVGSIVAQLLAAGFSDGFLSTTAGDITVFIPSNLAVTIRAQNTAVAQGVRRIVSEFPEVNVRLDGSLVVGEGALNGGGPLLRLAGSGGTIFIRRGALERDSR